MSRMKDGLKGNSRACDTYTQDCCRSKMFPIIITPVAAHSVNTEETS